MLPGNMLMKLKQAIAAVTLSLVLCPAPGSTAAPLLEPGLTVPKGAHHGPRVALTLDACQGQADERILKAVIANRVPVTIFATGRWLRRNPQALAVILSNPTLFEVENHGERHVLAIDRPMTVFGLKAAGSPAAVTREIEDGANTIAALTGRRPTWFRGAAAQYTASSIALVSSLGFRLAGYAIAADGGARLGREATARRIATAHDGDVILAHVNQPSRPAGLGVVDGILALKARGFAFVRLDQAVPPPGNAGPALTH